MRNDIVHDLAAWAIEMQRECQCVRLSHGNLAYCLSTFSVTDAAGRSEPRWMIRDRGQTKERTHSQPFLLPTVLIMVCLRRTSAHAVSG